MYDYIKEEIAEHQYKVQGGALHRRPYWCFMTCDIHLCRHAYNIAEEIFTELSSFKCAVTFAYPSLRSKSIFDNFANVEGNLLQSTKGHQEDQLPVIQKNWRSSAIKGHSLQYDSRSKKSRASRSKPLKVPLTFQKGRPGKLYKQIKVLHKR